MSPVLADYPVVLRGDKLVASEKPLAAWTANLPIPMLGQYRTNLARLRGIGFEIGKQDWNPPLIAQAHDLDALLTANGIPHEFEEFTGSHMDKLGERLETKALPFVSRCSNNTATQPDEIGSSGQQLLACIKFRFVSCPLDARCE